ncbi:winged helix-turn-helix domain-containing protein [Jiangella mangrovi]|uniref:DNA-binding GntR family transcriptional regulator n=1 Tax=Jiangella mangrovi TaxID=1524084 RepID=A0A7W9GQT5_9ACTN|nr:winged helix-turn-helix domain-containing protein [Jiangella mangrovi]MBB5788071.1 DNA-binding GntR family transcriptional regulator [Jiangella mangrovi]
MGDAPEFRPQGHELLYVAIADHITARIEAGELKPGARLAPERDLAVAYLTVRRAMVELRERGRILTVHGKGTFVAPDQPSPDA